MGLKRLRLDRGYTYRKLAELSGVNYQKIWQIEHGIIQPENISLRIAMQLCAALACPPEELLRPDENEHDN